MANNDRWASNSPPEKGACRICEASGETHCSGTGYGVLLISLVATVASFQRC